MERFWLLWPLWSYLIFEVAVVMIFFAWLNDDLKKIWRWLKGSRTTYYLDIDGLLKASTKKLRTPIDRVETEMKSSNQAVIEFCHGWFRRSSAIYGDYHTSNWKITKVLGQSTVVDLREERGLPVKTALQLINTYPSLQAMLDRIAELENQLAEANNMRQEWLAGLIALGRFIDADRQRFRSQSSQGIRAALEVILRAALNKKFELSDSSKSDAWLLAFSNLTDKLAK